MKLCVYRLDEKHTVGMKNRIYRASTKNNFKKKKKKKSNYNLPASHLTVEGIYDVVFFFSKTSMFDVWPEIIKPSQPATLATSLKTC